MSRRALGVTAVAAIVVAAGVVAWSVAGGPGPIGDPPPSSTAPGAAGGAGPVPATRPAIVLQAVPLRREPGGDPVLDEFGENPELTRAGQRVTILEDRVVPGSGQWVRVYVEVDPTAWPGDLIAWLPVAANGSPVLDPQDIPPCPATLDLAGLAALVPLDRLRCAGADPITLEARVVFPVGYAAYEVQPGFFGGREPWRTTVGLAEAENAFGMYGDPGRPWLDAVVAPGVPRPPVDVDAELTGRFDHPAAVDCRRTYVPPGFDLPPPADAGPPAEAAADSVAWCRSRFVITGWTITSGPERRPPVAGEVQLHRTIGGECAGVGMDGPLVFRIDPAEPDPVWIERPGDDLRIIPRFSSRFAFVWDPEPGVSDGVGLVIRDGTAFDPNGALGGHGICPSGQTISIE